MKEDRDKDIGIGEEVFVVYLNDNNEKINGFVTLISISDSLLTFKTNRNTITIPTSRLIKMKRRGDNES